MDIITTDKVKELAQIHEPHCISIFIPTYRAGHEVNEKVDQKHLKNKIKETKNKLESVGLKEREIKELLDPVNELMNNTGFWKLQSDGLAIFRNRSLFEYYTLPVIFDPYTYVADHFYPLPVMPYVNDKLKFFLLAISIHGVKFYEGFSHQINEVEMGDLLPGKLQDVVGYDFEEKYLNSRSSDERGRATFHGHGSASDEEKKIEILKYFNGVNEGLMKFLNGKSDPLVLASVDYLVPIYKEANDYKYLHEDFISGNPQHEEPVLLHEKAKDMLKAFYDRERLEKLKSFEFALSNMKASYKEEEIVSAAINKRIDTLFVKKGEELWGEYDQESNMILEREKDSLQGSDMINLAAMHTIFNGGKVYLLDPDEMPESGSKLNSIYRF